MLYADTKSIINIEDYTKNKRELNIDLIKTILVLGMILSHSLDFFIIRNPFTSVVGGYFNLVSFSGFMCVFGYNAYNAYIKNDNNNVSAKIIKNIIILIACYYISGFFYEL